MCLVPRKLRVYAQDFACLKRAISRHVARRIFPIRLYNIQSLHHLIHHEVDEDKVDECVVRDVRWGGPNEVGYRVEWKRRVNNIVANTRAGLK